MKLLSMLLIALLPACAGSSDADISDPVQEPRVAGSTPCDAGPGEYETACFDEGIGACCLSVSIPHEYEMMEARKNGDIKTAEIEEQRMLEALETGCSLDHQLSCASLNQLDSSAK